MIYIGTDNTGFLKLTWVLERLVSNGTMWFGITFSFSEPLGKKCDKMFVDLKTPATNSGETLTIMCFYQYIFTRMLYSTFKARSSLSPSPVSLGNKFSLSKQTFPCWEACAVVVRKDILIYWLLRSWLALAHQQSVLYCSCSPYKVYSNHLQCCW